MSVLGVIDRYVIRSVLTSVGLVVLVLLSLGGLFLFMGQQDDIGVGRYTAVAALQFVLLNLPQQAWELLPISALIGALIGLGNLARGSELVVMRTSGLSVWRVARPVALAGLLLSLASVLVGEVIGPPLEQYSRQQKAFAKFNDVSVAGSGDAWVRDGNLLVNVERQTGESQFGGMVVYEISADGRLQAIGRAVSARAGEGGSWSLEQYSETRFEAEQISSSRASSRDLASNVTAEFLGIAASVPSRLPTRALWAMVRHLEVNGLESDEARFAFWSRIARTLAPIFAVLLALPFVFGSLRASGAGAKVALGLILGIAFFLLQRMLESGAVVFNGSPILFAWAPTLLMAAAALILIRRTR
jgi:lipopolysaccharide export system permease protein